MITSNTKSQGEYVYQQTPGTFTCQYSTNCRVVFHLMSLYVCTLLYLLLAISCISKANFCPFKHQNYTHLLTYMWIAADTGRYK